MGEVRTIVKSSSLIGREINKIKFDGKGFKAQR